MLIKEIYLTLHFQLQLLKQYDFLEQSQITFVPFIIDNYLYLPIVK